MSASAQAADIRASAFASKASTRMVIRIEQGMGRYAIPTIRDRVVQTAVKLVIEPIFEADLYERACSYRPGRGGAEAIK